MSTLIIKFLGPEGRLSARERAGDFLQTLGDVLEAQVFVWLEHPVSPQHHACPYTKCTPQPTLSCVCDTCRKICNDQLLHAGPTH